MQPAPCGAQTQNNTKTTALYHILPQRDSLALCSHHNAGQEANSFPTVRVWDHVPISDGEEGDRDQPHGSQEVAGYVLVVVIPANTFLKRGWACACTFKGTVWKENVSVEILLTFKRNCKPAGRFNLNPCSSVLEVC